MVIYFSGTGNSRFVAERIAELTGETALNATEYIKEHKTGRFEQPGNYVFVSPVYVSAPPKPFMDFIRESRFPGQVRAYFVMTCAGGMGGSPEYCRKLSAEKGFSYLGTAQVIMPQNYLVFFKTNSAETCSSIINAALPKIDRIVSAVKASEELPDSNMKKWEYLSTAMILDLYYRHFMNPKPFRTTDRCISCGKCVSVCPENNITLTGGRPQWGDRCIHCMACINLCPKDAIEYGRLTAGKPRYKGPEKYRKAPV